MKKYLAAAFALANVMVMAAPALAQFGGGDKGPSSMEIEMDRRKRAAEEADRGYRQIIKNTTPEKETKTDPWANARTPTTSANAKK